MATDDPAIATLEVKIENLTSSISQLNRSVEQNNEKLERLAVLEVSHNNSSKAIERAFVAISKVETVLESHIASNNKVHDGYNRWIWTAVGFCSAVSVLWTIVGYRMNSMIDEQLRATVEMRMHIHDDKIKDLSDIQRLSQPANSMGGQNGVSQPR